MLCVLGYSQPVNYKNINLKKFINKIYTLKKQPNVTPYVTSYYKKDWGFCMPERKKRKLNKTLYDIKIDSKFSNGNLKVGEIYLKGKSKKEILISSYICHPLMGSNEISGPTIALFISKWLDKIKSRKFSYRIIFSSETIGTIAYIHKRFKLLKNNVIGGYVLTCLGDDKCFSYLKTKSGNSISDKIALKVLKGIKSKTKIYSWLNRGSDERQYNSPNVELNIGSLMRSKYGEYKEYHTDQDKLGRLVTKKSLFKSFQYVKKVINQFENEIIPITSFHCEPFLTKKKLYSTISKKDKKHKHQKATVDFISYCNGDYTIEEIAKKINLNFNEALKLGSMLKKKNLITF